MDLTNLSVTQAAPSTPASGSPGWQPPQWGSQPALTSLIVPTNNPAPAINTSSITDFLGNPVSLQAPAYTTDTLVFDAVLKIDHSREMRRTEHPIQTSSTSPVTSISDHAYQLPTRVVLEIGMSDAMASYSNAMWSGNTSKSVSAYQRLVDLMTSRTLVTLNTRLQSYQNMLVQSVQPSDSVKTRRGLRATVIFTEVFLAGVSIAPNAASDDTSNPASTRANTTGSTPMGTMQTQGVPASVSTNNAVSSSSLMSGIPGAGDWSSINTSLDPTSDV
jgi:hypothetical protein